MTHAKTTREPATEPVWGRLARETPLPVASSRCTAPEMRVEPRRPGVPFWDAAPLFCLCCPLQRVMHSRAEGRRYGAMSNEHDELAHPDIAVDLADARAYEL